ncbi:MAG: NmrA family protein [Candidatus Solibacter sp.]|nr:NmrA family protein [Candidatus Solibacter sp.]
MRHLRERGFPVRVMTRDPDQPQARALPGHGVEVVRGDLNDPATLTRAMDEVHGVHSVQDSKAGPEAEVKMGTNLADSAKRSGIAHFVYSSVASADQHTGIPHFESKYRIEEHIRGTGMPYTIVRPAFFMENWLSMRQDIDSGTLHLPLDPETRLQMIAVTDIGGVVAMAFEKPGKWQGRTIELAGDELSMTELAQALSVTSGHEVRYVQIPWDEFEEKAGKEITTMYRWFQDTGYHVDVASVRQENPELMKLAPWLNTYWNAATQSAG